MEAAGLRLAQTFCWLSTSSTEVLIPPIATQKRSAAAAATAQSIDLQRGGAARSTETTGRPKTATNSWFVFYFYMPTH